MTWLSVAGLTDVGRERELNEDRFYYRVVQASDEEPLGLFVVADGMGGHLAGEVASQWTVQTLKRELAPLFRPQDPSATRRLDAEALAAVGSGVHRASGGDRSGPTAGARGGTGQPGAAGLCAYPSRERPGDMGSTLTLAVVEDDQATVAHVGDSRAYLWRDGAAAPTDRGPLGARGAAQAGQDHARRSPRAIPTATFSTAAWASSRTWRWISIPLWPCSPAMRCCSVPTGCGTWSIP